MATRSVIRITPKETKGQDSNTESARKHINFYHHWDGSPSGVGRELEHFLRGRDDGETPIGESTWDAARIAEELLRSASGYQKSDGLHGDVEYGYVIDCNRRTLTCYDLDYGQCSIGNANVIKM